MASELRDEARAALRRLKEIKRSLEQQIQTRAAADKRKFDESLRQVERMGTTDKAYAAANARRLGEIEKSAQQMLDYAEGVEKSFSRSVRAEIAALQKLSKRTGGTVTTMPEYRKITALKLEYNRDQLKRIPAQARRARAEALRKAG